MFWVVVFRGVLGCFHLLHVGGPSHPNILWDGDYGREGGASIKGLKSTFSHFLAGVFSLNFFPHSWMCSS